jgi:hypothetical protein
MSSELSFSFSTRRKFIPPKFTEDLQHNMVLEPTVFEASNIGVNSSTSGANIYTMIRGPEDPGLIISMPKLLHVRRGNRSFHVFAGRAPGRLARNRFEPFTQFAGNERFSSPLGPTPVDRRPIKGKGRKMQ